MCSFIGRDADPRLQLAGQCPIRFAACRFSFALILRIAHVAAKRLAVFHSCIAHFAGCAPLSGISAGDFAT